MRQSRGPTRFGRDLRTALAAGLIVVLLTLTGATWRIDARYYDWLTARSAPEADSRIVIVAIDAASLEVLGRWPWPRALHALLLDRLAAAGVAGVGMTIQFAEPDPLDRWGDAALASAVSRLEHVVLPVWAEAGEPGGPPIEIVALPALIEAGAEIGHVGIDADADGLVRQAHLRAGLGTPHWPALALALHQRIDPSAQTHWLGRHRDAGPAHLAPMAWVRDRTVRIPFADEHDFAQVSFADVLHGRIPLDALAGRWVLLGVTAAGIGQTIATPLDDGSTPIPGVTYQAHLLSALASGRTVVDVAPAWQVPFAVALVLIPVLALRKVSLPALHTSFLLALAALLALVGSALLLHAGWWFPPFPVVTTLLLCLAALLVTHLLESQHLARSDALTGLANRYLFELMLDRELAALRRTRRPLSLLLIDVDHFKHFNDTRGHRAGDEILRTIGRTIRRHARRPRDLAARYGGDELVVVLPETRLAAAGTVADRMVAAVRELAIPHPGLGPDRVVTLSIGVACDDGATADRIALLDRADAALYRAKQLGRDRSCCADPGTTSAAGTSAPDHGAIHGPEPGTG